MLTGAESAVEVAAVSCVAEDAAVLLDAEDPPQATKDKAIAPAIIAENIFFAFIVFPSFLILLLFLYCKGGAHTFMYYQIRSCLTQCELSILLANRPMFL